MKKFIIVGAIASLLITHSAFAFTSTPNDGAHFFTKDGHRYFGYVGTENLVGKIFPEIASPKIEQHIAHTSGNFCSLNMVGKIPTAADIAAIKAYRCTKVYEGSVVLN